AEKEGLKIWAIENFDPSMWYDILLDGPRKEEQMQLLQEVIRRLGRVGIAVMGYNFSIAGVAGRKMGPFARGQAETVFVDGRDERPLPDGMVWNMWYRERGPGHIAFFSHDELWRRLKWFLDRLIPVAEQAGVRLAAHPDDPPFPVLRQTPRLIYEPWMFQKLIDLHPSPANALEFCVGTSAEMQGEGDLYDILDACSRQGRIAYVHLRNVKGKIPKYQETFLDEGDVDVRKVLQILRRNNFDGVIIPDHTPLLSCAAPWHGGMAYAMGYIRAMLQSLE
ncbi:mannonate dehydratase, partial [Thermogutta sp.]|uniref:mannonate dehydratase n=1 Tax=Thermogutta sp. TaxID=1962930 RepID=UPI003C7C63F6